MGAEDDRPALIAQLQEGVAKGARVTRFEVADPSLETIFIELVGRSPDDDTTVREGEGAPGLSVIEGAA